jgi:hypothetical protein
MIIHEFIYVLFDFLLFFNLIMKLINTIVFL